MTTLPLSHDGWTVASLAQLPDHDGFRYELVDGSLLVSPSPTNAHNSAATELAFLLRGALDPDWRAVAPGAVRFDDRNYREPDVIVVPRASLAEGLARPQDVLLVVEVMSPGSVSSDRVAKPAQYARAGIRDFWRLELEPDPALVTYELDGEVYRETGHHTDLVEVRSPVPLRFRLGDLLADPRR